ncbi:MAG: hypothetical protein ABI536_01490 [Gallionella sp.]
MRHGRTSVSAGLLLLTVLLGSCGGNNTDVFPWDALTMSPTSGPDSFLLFPNPQKQADGSLQTNTTAYATAYYEAIDPNNDKDTLTKWKTANGFGDLTTGTETTVVVGDVKDLGYGRRITARQNISGPLAGTIAVMVENYLVSPAANYTYSSLNLDAAVVQDQRWHVGTNGIEFSSAACITGSDPTTCNTTKFAKFYTFDPTTGQRLLAANLDGRGDKAMPGICISCHGGRGDPLTPAIGSLPTGKALFPWVGNSASQKRGDVQAHMQPLIADSFGYSTTPGYTRADQEAQLKTINLLVLCSYPVSAYATYPTGFTEDVCRRQASGIEWGGSAAAIIKAAYGGDGLPSATFSDSYLPTGWQTATAGTAAQNLYQTVVAPYCRTCHIQRGTEYIDDLNFDNYCTQSTPGTCDSNSVNPYNAYFYGYASRIKAHVIDRGNMPLAKIVYERFWGSNDPDTLATFLQSAQTQAVRDSSGAVLKPGRPVADPGPDRTTASPATLSAANSLYATTYSWSIVSGSGGSLSSPNSVQMTLTGAVGTTYGVQLVVGNGTTQSAPVTVNITIDSTTSGTYALPIAAANIHFSDIKSILQDTVPIPGGSGNFPAFQYCTGCHAPGGGPPIFYINAVDRNMDGTVGTDGATPVANPTDDQWFWTELRGRINFTDVAASPLLRKPSGYHHGGGLIFDTTSTTPCVASPGYPACQPYATLGAYYKAQYNKIVLWILNGAPQ